MIRYNLGQSPPISSMVPGLQESLDKVAQENKIDFDAVYKTVDPKFDVDNWNNPDIVGYEQVPESIQMPYPTPADLPNPVIYGSRTVNPPAFRFVSDVIQWILGAKRYGVTPKYDVKYQKYLIEVLSGRNTQPGNDTFAARFAAWIVLRQYDFFIKNFTGSTPINEQSLADYVFARIVQQVPKFGDTNEQQNVITAIQTGFSLQNDPKENIASWLIFMIGFMNEFVRGKITRITYVAPRAAYLKLVPVTKEQFDRKVQLNKQNLDRLDPTVTEDEFKNFVSKYGEVLNPTKGKTAILIAGGLAVVATVVYFRSRRTP
jgi:hypothetical protein